MSATRVPGYEVGEALGRDGFGVVYRARQDTTGREVAVRVDSRAIPGEADQRRFLRGVRLAGRLSAHPHVVEVHDGGVLPDARPYLVTELCEDGSLAGRVPLPPREVAETGQRIADALAAAHDLGVPHGDVRPGNLLVKPYGTVGLAGFGLATVIEAAHQPPPVPLADVHDLAVTLYALLAGSPPDSDRVEDLPGVPPGLMAVLRRGLAEDPARGYPDAAALRADLSQLTVADLSGPGRTGTPPASPVAPVTTDTEQEDASAPRPAGRPPVGEPAVAPVAGRRAALVVAVLAAVVVAVLAVVAVGLFLLFG